MSDTPPNLYFQLRSILTKPTAIPNNRIQNRANPAPLQSLSDFQSGIQGQESARSIPVRRIEDRRSALSFSENKAEASSQYRKRFNISNILQSYSSEVGLLSQPRTEYFLSVENQLRVFSSKTVPSVEEFFAFLGTHSLHIFHPPPHASQMNTQLGDILQVIFKKLIGKADCTIANGDNPIFSQILTKFPRQQFPKIHTLKVAADKLGGYYRKFPHIQHLELINCEQVGSVTEALNFFKDLGSLSIVSSPKLTSLEDLVQAKETVRRLRTITLRECPKIKILPSEACFKSLITFNIDASVTSVELSHHSDGFCRKMYRIS